MKKTLAVLMTLIVVFPIFSIFTPQVKASDVNLTPENPLEDYDPSWSPDGTKIAYVGHITSWYRHIRVMNKDGTGKEDLTSGNVVDASPAYSPDGTMIVFQRHGFRGDYFDIMILNLTDLSVTRKTFNGLPNKNEGTYEQPRWSEDGTKLIFHYGNGTTGPGDPIKGYWICVMPASGNDTDIQLQGRGMYPQFVYNDTTILFNTDLHLGAPRIALRNATDDIYLTAGPNDQAPHMCSTTNRIVFVRNGDLYVMDENGNNLKSITSDGTNGFAVWSPDGRCIAYDSDKSGNTDIWLRCRPSGDINCDFIVDISDVVIAGTAFGSRPGDPKWDQRADLNGDNLIDIFDMVIIGIHYGETGC